MSYIDPVTRVPFFFFKDIEKGVDAEATKDAGYEVPKLVTMIMITPHGHRGDPMEFYADEWIERKIKEAKDGRYDMNWVTEFKAGLAAYREGKALPRSGTPLLTWERILKSRRETLAIRYPTVEDLAAVPDATLGDIGLDGRVLRDMARYDMQAKKDLSPVVKELADTNEKMHWMQQQMDQMRELIATLQNPDLTDSQKPKAARSKQTA
jgi:hypothetical protein